MDYANLRAAVDRGEARKGEIWSEVDRAAQRGDAEAQFTLGYRWFRLYGAHYRKARVWLHKAASAGLPEAQRYLAEVDAELHKQRKALHENARAGSAQAQRDIGCLLATDSDGLGQDLLEGRNWYEKAAQQGHQDAQYNVGLMFLEADEPGVGLAWLQRAASGPDADTARDAAKLLSHFQGIEITDA